MNHRISVFAGAWALALSLSTAQAADVVVRPASGSSFVVKDASGTSDRLRVQESGAISLPGVVTAPVQTQVLCMGALGDLGPCVNGMLGGSYNAGAGLNLAGTTFSVAPAYRLPQSCAANQVAQWNGATWACGSAGANYIAGIGLALSGASFSVAPTYQLPQGCSANQIPQWSGAAWSCGTLSGVTMPAGTVNQTLRYDASNALAINNLLQAFGDGGLLAGGTIGSGGIPATGAGTREMWYPAKGAFRTGYVTGTQWDDSSIGLYSLATGVDTIASGQVSTALGSHNTASGDTSTAIGGGTVATGSYSTAMGFGTQARGKASTALGYQTTSSADGSTSMGISTTASAGGATAMGQNSIASGNAATAMGNATASGAAATAMGQNATADADYTTAIGHYVGTNGHIGSFIYGDYSHLGSPSNTADNEFMVIASGGIKFYTDPTVTVGAQLAAGASSWTTISDRDAKTAVLPVDTHEVLKKVVALPLNTWQYKTQDAKYRHMGPMAQDFYAAFELGESNKGIDTVDADGVAFAAIQGLNALLTEKDAKIAALETELSTQKREIAAQKIRLTELSSMAADLAEVKAQLAALRRSAPSAMATVASVQP